MSDEAKPWWQTLPAIITALATLLGAVTTLLVALTQSGGLKQTETKLKPPPKVLVPQKSAAESSSLKTVLADHLWEARSNGLACQGLSATFEINGTFDGWLQNPQNGAFIQPQRVSGKWEVAGPRLLLTYDYIDLAGRAKAKFTIQITYISESSLSGRDTLLRSWKFERMD